MIQERLVHARVAHESVVDDSSFLSGQDFRSSSFNDHFGRPSTHGVFKRRGQFASATVVVGTTMTLAAIPWAPWNPAAYLVPPALFLSAFLIGRRENGAQLLARAIWWATLLFGAVLAFAAPFGQNLLATASFSTVAGISLLMLGRSSLFPDDHHSPGLRAVKFRGELTLAFLLGAGALLGVLFQWALAIAYIPQMSEAPALSPILAFGGMLTAALVIGVIGLYRMRVFGLLLVPITLAAMLGVVSAFPLTTSVVMASTILGVVLVLETMILARVGRALLKRDVGRASALWQIIPAGLIVSTLIALGIVVAGSDLVLPRLS